MLLLTDVAKSFREPDGGLLPILSVREFRVGAGEQVVLMGRSGSGKSTLLHIIAGIIRPDRGSVRIHDHDITVLSESARDHFRAENLGYVFQTFNLLSGFSAIENVMLGMTFSRRRLDAARARSLLDRVGLAQRLHHKPGMLSVGEQQRVAVARALANRPKLLLADEPTANVDAAHQQQIIDLLRATCREERIALLLVTHTPEVARQFDRVERIEDFNQPADAAATRSPRQTS